MPDAQCREISVNQAATWLAKNTVNRPITKSNFEKLKLSMEAGKFTLNGEPIIFSKSGRLLDGQHRLKACVATNIPFKSIIVTGVEDDAFDTIDSGKSRTLRDVLSLDNEKDTGLLAASLTLLEGYEHGSIGSGSNSGSYQFGTNESRRTVLQLHPGIRDVVEAVKTLMPKAFRLPSVVVGIYLAGLRDPFLTKDIFTKLRTGANLQVGDPVLLLRNYLLSNQESRKKDRNSYILGLVVKTVNAAFAKTDMKLLRFRVDESFPTMLEFVYGRKVDASAALARTKRGLVLS